MKVLYLLCFSTKTAHPICLIIQYLSFYSGKGLQKRCFCRYLWRGEVTIWCSSTQKDSVRGTVATHFLCECTNNLCARNYLCAIRRFHARRVVKPPLIWPEYVKGRKIFADYRRPKSKGVCLCGKKSRNLSMDYFCFLKVQQAEKVVHTSHFLPFWGRTPSKSF